MSRVALLSFCLLMCGLAGWYVSSEAPAKIGTTRDAELFWNGFVTPALGNLSKCLKVVPLDGGWLDVRYVSLAGCPEKGSPVLDAFRKPGRRRFKIVGRGSHQLGGLPVQVGPSPEFSPGFTRCSGQASETLLLDPADGLGYAPGDLMSDRRDLDLTPGQLFAHEAGHSACNFLRSDSEALACENWYLWHHNPDGPLRFFHHVPQPTRGK